jgi:hypothetical protein
MTMTDRWDRALRRALRYQPCADCTYNFISGEGERSCSYGDCPYLPTDLDPRCPTCRFNFYTGDGDAACGDPPSCDFAVDEAPYHVDLLRRWLVAREGVEAAG